MAPGCWPPLGVANTVSSTVSLKALLLLRYRSVLSAQLSAAAAAGAVAVLMLPELPAP
jgi:hypothetical protein